MKSSLQNKSIFYNLLVSRLILLLACIVGIILVFPFLGEKLIFSADYITHYGIAKVSAENISSGKGIFTVFPQMLGVPFHLVYQPLHHLIIVALHFLLFTEVSISFLHNFTVACSLIFFPLSIYYCLRKFDFPHLLCSMGALFALAPISGWGHTINTYLDAGIVTQSLGTLIFPIAIGYVYQFVRFNKGNVFFSVILISILTLLHPLFLIFVSLIFTIFGVILFSKLKIRKIILLVSIIIVALLISSFWVVPFIYYKNTHANLSDWYHLPTRHEVSFTTLSFVKTFFGGEVLDKVDKDSILTARGFYRQDFRWPHNANSGRLPFFTIFTIIGFLISSFKIREFKHSFLSLGWIGSLILLLGRDDIKILSRIYYYPSLRGMVLFEFLSICLAAIGLFYVIKFIFVRFNSFSFKGKYLAISCLLLLIIGTIFFNIYKERYNTSRDMVRYLAKKQMGKITSLYSKATVDYFSGRTWFLMDPLEYVRGLFSFDKFPIVYTDFLRGYLLSQKIITMNYKDFRHNKKLINLYNIKYILRDKKELAETEKEYNIKNLGYTIVDDNKDYLLFNTNTKSRYFEFLNYKPILAFVSERNWARICRLWLSEYSEGNLKNIFIARSNTFCISNSRNINVEKFPVIFLFDYRLKNKEKAKRLLSDYIDSGGEIVSFKPILGLPVKIIKTKNFSRIIRYLFYFKKREFSFNNNYDFHFNTLLRKSDQYIAKVRSSKERFLLFKMNYYSNWEITIDGKSVETYRTVPSFITVRVPSGKHTIKVTWHKTELQNIFIFISLFTFIGLAYYTLRNKNERGLFNFFDLKVKKIYEKFFGYLPVLILIFSLLLLTTFYYKEKVLRIPVTIYPGNNSYNYPVETRFYWNKIPYSDLKYDLQVAPTADFSNPLLFYRKRDKRYIITSKLEETAKYYWRVRARKGRKVYKWSEPIPFYTMDYSLPSK